MLKLLVFTFFIYSAISQCSNGTYDLAGNCTSCHSSCTTCNGGTANDCQSCTLPKKFFTGKCVDCPYNSYLNSTGDCNACHHTCDDCSGPAIDECTSCKNNMVRVAGKCVCPTGTFLHSSTYTCLPCYPACGSCTGPLASQCLTCPIGLSLQVSACSCPAANYFNTGTLSCETCNPSCAQCSGPNATQCTSCKEGKYLTGGQCLSCNETCQTCSGPDADDCMKCTSDKVLMNGQCIVKKNIGCHETCQQCQGPAQDECVVCNIGLAFVAGGKSGFCVPSCPQSYYLYNATGSARCIAQTLLKGALSVAKDTNTYRITFNADISQFYNDIVNLMTIQVQYQPKQKTLGFTQKLSLVSKKVISIFLDFDSHLLPSNYLYVTFNTPTDSSNLKFKLLDSYLSIELQESMEYSESMQQAIGTASSLNSAGSQGNGAFSFSSTFFLKSIHAIRSQIMEKMLSYFIFMNVDFPPNLIQYYQDMLDNDDSFLPDMFSSTTQRIEDEKEEAQTAVSQTTTSRRMLASTSADLDRSSRYNGLIQNQMFLANYGSEITVLFIALCLGVVAEVAVRLLPAKYHSRIPYKIAIYCSRSLIYNFILNEFIENYHDMALYSMVDVLNIADFRAKDAFYYLAGLIALIAVLIMPFGFFFFMRWLFRKMKEYKAASNKEEHKLHDLSERLEIIDRPYKSERLIFFMYNLILMTRSFGFAVMIVFAATVPSLQVLYCPLVTLLVIAYLIKYKPFNVKMQLILTLTYECLFLFASFFVMVLHFYNINHIEEGDTRTNLGFVIMACSLTMMGLDFLSMIVEILEMRKHCKRRKTKQVAPLAFSAVPLQSPTPSSNPIQLTSPTPELRAGNISSSFNGLKIMIDENDSHADSSVMQDKSESKSPSLISFTPQKKNSHLKVHPGGVSSQLLSTVLKSRKSAVWPTRDSISINPVSPSASEREPGTFSTRNDNDQKVLISQYESEKDEGSSTTKRRRNEPEKEKEKKLVFPLNYESEKESGSFSTTRNKKDKVLLTPDSEKGESTFLFKLNPEKKDSPKEDKDN